MLLATDGSEHSMDAAHKAAEMARTNRSEVIIVHVLHPYHHMIVRPRAMEIGGQLDFETEEEARKRGSEIMVKTKKIFDSSSIEVETRFLVGNVAKAIIDEAKKEKVDLIVVGATGHGEVSGWLFGSIAEKIARNAMCPVLIVR